MKRFLDLVTLRREYSNCVNFILNSKPSFKYALCVLTLGFLLGLINPLHALLSLTINNVFNFHLWRVITCILPEPNVILYGWSVLSVYQLLVFIEPVWGLHEILKFAAIIQLLTTLTIAILGLFSFAVFHSLNLFYYVPISGFTVVSIGALVSLKQFLPDTVILTTPYGRLKNGHLPLTSLFLAIVLWIIGMVRGSVPLQIAFGLQISWAYLRFFQTQPGSDHVGDDSEHFTWASFFPRRTQPAMALFSKAFFSSLVVLKICRKPRETDLNMFEPFETLDPSTSLTSVESRDAERKRQKALRVLNERLSAAKYPSKERPSSAPPETSLTDDPTMISPQNGSAKNSEVSTLPQTLA